MSLILTRLDASGVSPAQQAADEQSAAKRQKANMTRRVIKRCVVPGDPGYQRPQICYQADEIRKRIVILEADLNGPPLPGNRHARRKRAALLRGLIANLRRELSR